MTITCNCGNLHYSTQHYFQVHGDYVGKKPFKVQMPFLSDGTLFEPSKHLDPTKPYPSLTYKWVCKYCGKQRATWDISTHEKDCEYSKYLTFMGSGATFTTPSPIASTSLSTPPPKPIEIPESELKKIQNKINNLRKELENIFNIPDADKGKHNLTFFGKEFDKVPRENKLNKNNLAVSKQIISYLVNWEEWEQKLEPNKIYLDKKRKPINWYLLGKLSWNHLTKIEKKVDPENKYLLSELLLLIPTKRKPWVPIIKQYFTRDKIKKISLSDDEKRLIVEYDDSNKTENDVDNLPVEQIKLHAYLNKNNLKSLTKKELLKKEDYPLRKPIEKLIKEMESRIIKFTEFDIIPFDPDREMNEIGNQENHWEDTWQEFLDTATDELDLKLKYNSVRYVWSKVIIERLIEKKDIGAINSFIYYYDDPNEQAIYNNSPWKEQIEKLRKPKEKEPILETKTPPSITPPASPPLKPTLSLTKYLKQLEQESIKYISKGTVPWKASDTFATYWDKVEKDLKNYQEATKLQNELRILLAKIEIEGSFFDFFINSAKKKRFREIKNRVDKIIVGETKPQENWQSIHQDFTTALTAEWKKHFAYEETKRWIKSGLNVKDIDFVVWLVNSKGLTNPVYYLSISQEKRKRLRVKYNQKEINWKEILQEIHHFFSVPQISTDDIDNFLLTKNFPDPTAGIDLKGINKDRLLRKFKNKKDEGAREELAKGKGIAENWKQYEPLQASGNGNCFFNSFSILLAGDEGLATQLRVKVCLGIMSRELTGTIASKNPNEILKEINDKLPSMSSHANYEAWRYLDDIAYMSEILKRPIRLIYRPNTSDWDKTKQAYQDVINAGGISVSEFVAKEKDSEKIKYEYGSWFTIYHVRENHFVPLVLPLTEDTYNNYE